MQLKEVITENFITFMLTLRTLYSMKCSCFKRRPQIDNLTS